MNDALTRWRWGGGGLFLALLLVVLMLVPLWKLRRVDHPLAGAQQLRLCPLLPPAPLPPGSADAKDGPGPASVCSYRPAGANHDLVTVSFTSTREMSGPEGGGDTERMFETWMKEVRQSYGNGRDLPAPKGGWRHAGAYKAGDRQSVLFEDGGVLVSVESTVLDAGQLERYAADIQKTLRTQK